MMICKCIVSLLALCIGVNHAAMQWTLIDDTNAVCNDYSRAGFFIERTATTKWIIFLESGGLCYSAETCNERFFKDQVRREYSSNTNDGDAGYDLDYNLTQTWESVNTLGRLQSDYINPYMTSASTYINDNQDFAEIDGRDFLDGSKQLNPMFYDFNRVVIPYCSSDMWLAEDDYVPDGVDLSSINPQKQFFDNVYSPEAKTLQFTFRGQTILKGVIKQLLEGDVLSDATEILLAGSSAGGLGVVNNVKWIISELENNTVDANVSVLVDSSWFINFRGNIYRRFDGTLEGSESNAADRKDMRLFDLIDSVPQCDAVTPTGSPCCVSLECVLLDERYFPVGQIPVMVVFSLYDIFLLADAIAQQIPPGVTVNQQPSLGGEFILTIAEYGGAMNSSIIDTTPQVNGLSFIATQCFQHVYFATSTLWGTDNILGSSSAEQLNVSLGAFGGSFTHIIESNVWNSYTFGDGRKTAGNNNTTESCDTSEAHTMQDAVNMWYRCRYNNNSLQFRDTCYSVHCHDSCPEEISLSDIETFRYPTWSRVLIICIVVSVAVLSIAAKIVFYAWEVILFARQSLYLERVADEVVIGEDETDGVPQFPTCDVDEVISVACLDLKYSVNFRKKKKVKDEKKDSTSISFAIADNIDNNEERNAELRRRRSLNRSSRAFLLTTGSAKDVLKTNNSVKVKVDVKSTEVTDKKQASCNPFKSERKEILKGISLYFNPGELVGIMGPSGCGKTTFLDLLTGRRRTGEIQGEIFINGVQIDLVRDEYISNTGYVLQLATPYYEELTVRDNITLAAQMKLPKTMSQREKFERVEQVIEVTGLKHVSETVVGGLSGPGLSGGQKKRVTIALQLLTMPKVIFLDEPTSGLDATSAIELLNHLNSLANSNRTVVLTIHQPRFEIFYMFHKLILLSDGKVAYHGVPKNAYAFFVEALMSSFLRKNLILPQIEEQNPADVIMDMLGKPHFRQIILDHYQNSSEPNLVKWAIGRASVKDFESMTMASRNDRRRSSFRRLRRGNTRIQSIVSQEDFVVAKPANWFDRLSVLEARAGKRSSLIWRLYLSINFLAFGFVLGTVYFQQDDPLLIVTAFCVYSVASAIFMFPLMQTYYVRALEVYAYENADGAGLPSDIVLQGFSRFTTMALVPVLLGSVAVYLLSINIKFWSASAFFQLVVIGMALNQTWIALLTCLICSFPSLAFRLSPVISSVAGFTSGFFIPISQTPWAYRWLFYINPNYYGFSASANILLTNINNCEDGDSIVECLVGSGGFILKRFNFDTIRPFMSIAILLLMTAIYLLLAIFSNWLRHTKIFSKLKVKLRSKAMRDGNMAAEYSRLSSPDLEEQNNIEQLHVPQHLASISEYNVPQHLASISEYDEEKEPLDEETIEVQTDPIADKSEIKRKWVTVAAKAKEEQKNIPLKRFYSQQTKDELLQRRKSTLALNDEHVVFKPGKQRDGKKFVSLVNNVVEENRQRFGDRQRQTLNQRLQQFNQHTNATKEVLKEQTEELINKPEEFETETEDSFRNITLKLMRLRVKNNALDVAMNSEVTGPKLLAASSAFKWKQKAMKSHPPKNNDSVEGTEKESDPDETSVPEVDIEDAD